MMCGYGFLSKLKKIQFLQYQDSTRCPKKAVRVDYQQKKSQEVLGMFRNTVVLGVDCNPLPPLIIGLTI